ncbi:hypothetical protein [Georgenia muralis]
MVLPIVIAAWAITAVTGAAGLGAGGKGVVDMNHAKSLNSQARTKYEDALAKHDQRITHTDAHIARLGQAQQDAVEAVCERFTRWLRDHEQQTRLLDRDIAAGIAAQQRVVVDRPGAVRLNAVNVVAGGVQAVGLGVAARAGAVQAVRQVGVASTGTAIKTLSGAAAQKATLAALGGGAVAAGGGGIAVGAAVLNVATIGPGVLVAGIQLNKSGGKALTEATEYSARVDVAAAEMKRQATVLAGIDARTTELLDTLYAMRRRAETHLAQLEAVEFDSNRHTDLFVTALTLVKGVAELVGARVINEQGVLDSASAGLAVKYRTTTRS